MVVNWLLEVVSTAVGDTLGLGVWVRILIIHDDCLLITMVLKTRIRSFERKK